MASTAKALLAVAAQQIGIREGRDRNGDWNNVQKFGAWYAEQVHNPGFNGVAWCDEFVSWCAAMSGNGDIIPLSAYVPGRLAWARSQGLTGGHYPPAPGDLGIVMDYEYGGNGQVTPHSRHIFIVERYLGDGRVQTIEGNTNDTGSAQGNGVYRLIRQDSETSDRYIYIRPRYAPAPAAPTTSRDEERPPAFNLADIKMDLGKGIDLASLHPKKGPNAHIARLESAIWNWRGDVFRKGLVSRYKLTTRAQLYSTTYTPMLSWMVGDSYRLLHALEPGRAWITPRQAAGKDPLPTYPGPAFLRRIGFTSIH